MITQRDAGIIALVLVLGGSFIPITEYWFSSSTSITPQFIWNGAPFRPIGLNYYPSTHPWTGIWEEFNAIELARDCELASELGVNCFRTFLQWGLIETGPGVYNTTIADRVVEFFNICSSHDIAVQFSFFDFGPPDWAHAADPGEMYTNQTLIDLEIQQLQYLIPRLNETKAAFIWDLRNEPSSSTIPISQFVHWVGNLSTAIRSLGDSHYIVVGGAYGNFDEPKAFAPFVDAVCACIFMAREMNRIGNGNSKGIWCGSSKRINSLFS